MPAWLSDAYAALSHRPAAGRANEWLRDNAYVIERAVRQIGEDLPRGYYSLLPSLGIDKVSRPPRVYGLAQEIARVTSLQLTTESVTRFVSAYQEVETLELAELWALPTMLRLTCIESLVSSLRRLAPELPALFDVPESEELPLGLEETECVARSVRGLATLSAIPWPEFVRATSAIDVVLRDDPAEAYSKLDAQTRDHYRRAVEDLARHSRHDEPDVARRAVAHAQQSAIHARAAHVGYWLVAEGRRQLERSLGYRARWRDRARRGLRNHATGIYLSALLLLTICFALAPGLYLSRAGVSPAGWVGAAVLLALPSSMLAVTVLHWTISRVLPPTVLPKLAFESGIPVGFQTAIAVPSLLGSQNDVEHLLGQIERHFLSNPDPNLRFVLLTDFPDADEQHGPEDATVLELAVRGIAELNQRHGSEGQGPFHLLHRERRFSRSEQRWIGWERKRGKLDELNRLLLGDDDTSFVTHEGDPIGLHGTRFVVTLDADTTLPQATAARLIGTLAHPLNRPEPDPASGRIRSGYTIVQPRVEASTESGSRSLFTRLYCGDTAIDIYSRAVSDVYQDLFGTGIYIGKAIYDVRGFSQSLEGRTPENAIASHDLFEGIHGRAALATDIVLYEDYPPTYLAYTRRLHRWVRGDWQLLPWLRRRVPGARHDYLPNRFATIDRWKIIDNLRRSLLPTALLLLIVSGWTWLPGHPLAWTLFAILAPAGQLFVDFATGLVRERWRSSPGVSHTLSDDAGRWFLLLVFLPHQAWVTTDAIVHTLIRVTFTKRHLLQWTTSAQTAASTTRRAGALVWTEMAMAPLIAVATGTALGLWRPAALPFAAPILALWLASPEVARRISRPTPVGREHLGLDDVAFLRDLARRTWLFFESFVGPDGHWLPPDNYQEDPNRVVAHRTSPTNIGMLLLSTLAAYDLGYIGVEQLALRLRNTLQTVERLEHYRGHLLNWYHTRTLEPLLPRYISTVDSGNLAAALLAVETGLSELERVPLLRAQRWKGLEDTIMLLQQQLTALLVDCDAADRAAIQERAKTMQELTLVASNHPDTWASTLQAIEAPCTDIEGILLDTVANRRESVDLDVLGEARLWLARLHGQIQDMRQDMESLTPWLTLLDATPSPPSSAGPRPSGPDLARLRMELMTLLAPSTPVGAMAARCEEALVTVTEARRLLSTDGAIAGAALEITNWLDDLETAIGTGEANARQLLEDIDHLASQAEGEAAGMDFGLLYDPQVRHFFIGYNLTADQMDPHHYDLLASEARLASLVAIATGDVPVSHWFSLGRPLTRAEGSLGLLSWGGTMFEYLMPSLLVRPRPTTLLGVSERTAVVEQMADAARRGLPWGVSESGFAVLDADHNYQYRAFGVQGLGRKQGLDEDRVVAPYATALALPVLPSSAVQNLRRLRDLGMLGRFGFYEAIDFTPSRLPEGRDNAIIASHMSHHQGMILAAVGNALQEDALVTRFGASTRVQAASLLLQERVPDRFPIEEPRRWLPNIEQPQSEQLVVLTPWRPDPTGAHPSLHLLGNGRLASRVTDAGGGSIRWRDHAITRCIPDGTLDDAGLWIYVRDEETGSTWSVARQPTGTDGATVDVVFHAHMVELHRRQYGVAIRTDIAIGAGDDIEVRRVTVVNETDRPRQLMLTSYGEVVLSPSRDDAQHLAFSKLFVEGALVPSLDALVFARRPRSPDEHFPVMMHRLVADSASVAFSGFETDRECFLGRGGSVRRPHGLETGLSGRQGATLDPIMALGAEVRLAPYATEQLAFVTIVGPSRQSVDETAMRYDTLTSLDWLFSDAHVEAAREVRRLGFDPTMLPQLQALLSWLLAPGAGHRATTTQVASNQLGQQDLWALGISGDDPILLVETANGSRSALLPDLFRGHQLWRRKGMGVDLVILSPAATGYQDDEREDVHRLLEGLNGAEWLGRPAGIHLIRADQLFEEQRQLLAVSSGAVLDGDVALGSEELLGPEQPATRPLPHLEPTRAASAPDPAPPLERPGDLLFDNGLGGFSPDGREYVIHLEPGQSTPAPWCNILANDDFGCLMTETGGGYTWAGNSGEFRLTPWTNDPVSDPTGESLYLRDEETVEVWSPTPGPAGSDASCQVHHGAGYSEWHQSIRGLQSRVRVFVPTDDPVKIVELRLRNHDNRPRRITATYYARWVLGRAADVSSSHVVVNHDHQTQTLRARNRWSADFADMVAFLTADREPHSFTADRSEFLGREGDPSAPAALQRVGLGGTIDAGLDPCGCLQVHFDLDADEEVRAHFVLGAGRDDEHVDQLARRWQEPAMVAQASERLAAHWDSLLSTLTVQTPEPAMDLLLNRWALYQVLSSRVLARTGFYQSSGAFGFRDQLQDVLALLHCDAPRARAHILECASRQFEEGDVLHWWHPPLGRGVRTRCSDDLLWLPYVTARYVEATGDDQVLDEEIPFLSAPPLGPDEHDRYDLFQPGSARASLLEHCRRSLKRGLTAGPHGLPLIGDGDWNDGMNRVGPKGRGESVWLGWFGGVVASDFADLCDLRGEDDVASHWRVRAGDTLAAARTEGWDGDWYRRAFADDGEPWGSATSDECRIDSIAQSWAILSGAAPRERAAQALRSAESALMHDKDQLACLLWPPFDLTARDPGYIKAYPPGIRENGGQYSHAAAWLGWAFAEAGSGEIASRIFRMLNPIERTQSHEAIHRYRLEPYAVAADIASVEPHLGRGGWSWYTGAAAWTWRLGVEAILGIRRKGDRLQVEPQLPHHWPGFLATVRTEGGILELSVDNRGRGGGAVTEILVDGSPIEGNLVDLPTNGATHRVVVRQYGG
ncbi:MAG: cellobiose phosphorylase [Actinomycetia bacterium]|nr:cellobiose phosphorylase [Actinomycetes bacterium]